MAVSPHHRRGALRIRPAASRLAGALCALLLVAAGCAEGDAAPPSQSLPTVEVMRVESAPLVDTAVFSGQLDAEHSVMVKPEIEGVVESVEFEQGQSVSAGDVLFRLRSREQAARRQPG